MSLKIQKQSMTLPADNIELEKYILNNKILLTEKALSSIEYGIKNNLPFIEVFDFENSDYVITILSKDFLLNINHIYNFYLESENYELCPRIVKLLSMLKNQNSNEKETETYRNN